MLTLSLLCSGLGLLCWPPSPVQARLTGLLWPGRTGTPRDRRLSLHSKPVLVTAAVTFGCLAVVALGPVLVLAFGSLVAAAGWHWRSRARTRAALRATAAAVEAIRAMAGELRAGAHPADAAESAAADADPGIARALRGVAASVRLGGDLTTDSFAQFGSGVGNDVLARLARAWSLAHEHGLPLASVLDAVERDAEAQLRFATQLDARMAGPRASAGVLALLPLGGVALGEAMGAAPLHVLTTSLPGRLLFTAGAVLAFGGVVWSCSITGKATAA